MCSIPLLFNRVTVNYTKIEWESVVSAPFQENTYILWHAGTSDCCIVDPGFEPQKILDLVATRKLSPVAILNTHGHSDHIAGNAAMKNQWPDVPLVIGHGDAWKLTDPTGNLSAQHGLALISPQADQTVRHGETFSAGGMQFAVLETPGHSAGHVVFVHTVSGAPTVVVGGDVLFRAGVGRSDFPDGDFEALKRSIQEQLYTLPDDSIVLPGHGPETTIGFEKSHNPFVRKE